MLLWYFELISRAWLLVYVVDLIEVVDAFMASLPVYIFTNKGDPVKDIGETGP